MAWSDWLFGSADARARGALMNWRADWLTLHGASDAIIALSFVVIVFGIVWNLQRRSGLLHEHRVAAWLVGGFILVAGVTHGLAVVSLSYPIHGMEGLAKGMTAVLSGAAVGLIWPLLPSLARLPSSRELRDVNRRMRAEAEAHEVTLRELDAARRELESRVEARTRELRLANARFETALHGAQIHVFSQDRDLRYTWMYSPYGESAAAAIVGRSDDDLPASAEQDIVVAAKRQVLEGGEPADIEVSAIGADHRALYALRINPTRSAAGEIDGLMCAAIDVSRIRSLETEQRRLTEELGTALQRYETALHGSNVTVYTQDESLRYTSVSAPMFGFEVDQILGRTDSDLLAAESAAAMVGVKQAVLRSGTPQDVEFKVQENAATRWYDVHAEPLRDVTGAIVGVTCAAVDITGSKANDAHLRDLMREITHRSKNLLAVIQGMARQTARHAGSTERFLEQFGARLQAMSVSHDLLVQESWHGASLLQLVHSQLASYVDRADAPVTVEGPALLLKPEAAQTLGLALHELAANASRFGALSVAGGRVSIAWRRMQPAEGGGFEVLWAESGGPDVAEPDRRGFGSMVIERNLSRSLDADIDLSFPPAGVRCRMVIPSSHLASAA